jgi:hypothetical protein
MQSPNIYRVLSAWKNEGEILRYKQIKQFAVKKGLVTETNDRSLSRWLKKLVQEDLLEKTEKGYTLKAKPKVYQVFDYLNELRQNSADQIYDGEIGGMISHVCALTYLSFDETLIKTKEERIAFDTISVRIGELFWALYELRNILLKRHCGLPRLKLPDEVIRETFLGMLVESIGKHHETEELVSNYSSHMIPAQKKNFDYLWDINRKKSGVNDEIFLETDLLLTKIEKDPESYKKELKKRASIDLDKYSAEELLEKLARIRNWVSKNHEKEMKEKHCFSYTIEESELESNYRKAVLAKVTEGIRARHSTTVDFAIIATRHPATLDEYYTPEHILREAIEWAKKPPEDDWGKNIWKEICDDEKTFEGMVAERLVVFGWHHPAGTYAKMRLTPWIKRELAGVGDFHTILKLYSQKRKLKLKEDRKRINRFLSKMSEFSKKMPQKSVD